MTKQEFLDGLEERLLAEGAGVLVQENLQYYSGYIEDEKAKGRAEEEVLDELGNPALIARSILEAAGYVVDGIPDVNPGGDGNAYTSEEGPFRQENETREERPGGYFQSSSGLFGLGLIFAVIVIVVILLLMGFIALLSPFLVVILLIIFVVRLFGNGIF